MKLDYVLLDVFTTERLSGNPLAVFPRADGLLDDHMQRIAAELSLSETVFVTRPKQERHTAAIRIFTPQVELPFAGHPTVGTAVALGLENRTSAVRLEEKVGVITCVIEKVDKRTGRALFALPHLPVEMGRAPDKTQIALSLGLEPDDIGFGMHHPSVYSAGITFYLLPVKNVDVLRRARPERRGWAETYPLEHNSVYVYTAAPDPEDCNYAARMFSPGMGIGEDPATGSAAAALIGELRKDAGDGQTEFIIRQGVEIGRPSRITVQIRKTEDKLTHGGIGGHAVILGQGSLDLGD